jgi:hypothetical protein
MIADLLAHYVTQQHGEYRAACPVCDRGAKDDALAIKVDERGVVAVCHRCGTTASERREYSPAKARMQAVRRVAAPAPDWRPLWSATLPITPDSVAGQYLLHRGCRLPPAESDLRWIPATRHRSDHVGPALVARVTHAESGEALTVHRTWVTPTGKAQVDKPKLLWPGHPSRGGVVKLWPDEAVTQGLGIAEGLETSLALAHAMAPVWCCIDAAHVAAFPVLGGIEALTIAADHDAAGLAAARTCAARWSAAGREVRVVTAPQAGADLADLVTT